ncbi:MAG: UDP-glucose/GDP-mannose dehydrogenase family protein [Deltaproteobacteria bacterium]|jgi:GDP-mannose 6-dehydrogenase|nr:UDP-glucose/GDP-mannose dehydrogenase family protein [Deltaproteobacteria bacterium]
MKISIFGLGYVGCVSSVCLAKEGHDVIGVDVNQTKVDMINDGKSPIVEKDLNVILERIVKNNNSTGSLIATTNALRAVADTDISLICVGTPSNDNGSLKLDYVKRCAGNIGAGIREKEKYHVIVARSTMLPGTVEDVIIREVEYSSGKKAGNDFGAVMNPEFLRESTSIDDFFNPPVTVIGELDNKSGDVVQKMYHFLEAPFVRTDIKSAEMIKYANNTFHGLKVTFANEIGAICKTLGIDSHKVMDIFCMDNKLNLSSYYLKPGFAFGGSCLPKDLRAITYKAKEQDLNVPILSSIIDSNKEHIERVAKNIMRSGKKKIGILGLSFKAGTDDLRESPLVILTEKLIGKGYDISIYDKNVAVAKLFGANKEYIEKEIPHISSLMVDDIASISSHAEIIIIGNKSEEFNSILIQCSPDTIIYDLVRITQDISKTPEGYEGICW